MIKFNSIKRMFFGWEAKALWPKLKNGRILNENDRHATLIFLGSCDFSIIKPLLENLPTPPFKVGFGGFIDKMIFLPEKHPRVAAYNIKLFDIEKFSNYKKSLLTFFQDKNLHLENNFKNLLPHITISRRPFFQKDLEKDFSPFGVYFNNFCLYESLGNSRYKIVWSHSLQVPFEPIAHTADIAFRIYGEDVNQIFFNSFLALCFSSPLLVNYLPNSINTLSSLEDVIKLLNRIISDMDIDVGASFKAVSYSGDMKKNNEDIYEWEMIVDV